ncbi:MAG TPA: hypothetical protein VI814_10820 [Candidatus Limnocylindria bacterium]
MSARTALMTAALALVVLGVFVVDVATGPLIGFALFYLVPIGVAAWRVGRWPAVGIAIESFVAWLVADLVWRPPEEFWYSVWNGLTRLVIFTAAAILFTRVLEDRAELRGVEERRRRFLRLLERNLPEPIARADDQIARIEQTTTGAPPQAFALLHRAMDDLRYLSRDFLILGQEDIDQRPPQDVELAAAAAQAMRYVDQGRIDVAGGTARLVVRGEPERIEHAIAAMLRAALHATAGDIWLAVRERGGEAAVDVTARTTRWAADEDDELAIARLVARLYGGRLTTRTGDETITVTLAFPAHDAASSGR